MHLWQYYLPSAVEVIKSVPCSYLCAVILLRCIYGCTSFTSELHGTNWNVGGAPMLRNTGGAPMPWCFHCINIIAIKTIKRFIAILR